jgi:hypothetical protein
MDFLKLRRGIHSSETEESKTQGLCFTYPFATNVASAAACFCSCSHWDSSPSCSTCGWPTGAGRMELLHQTSCCCCSSSSQEVAGGNAWATCYTHELRHNYLSLLELRQVQAQTKFELAGPRKRGEKENAEIVVQTVACELRHSLHIPDQAGNGTHPSLPVIQRDRGSRLCATSLPFSLSERLGSQECWGFWQPQQKL